MYDRRRGIQMAIASSEHRREHSLWRTNDGTPPEFATPKCLRIPEEGGKG